MTSKTWILALAILPTYMYSLNDPLGIYKEMQPKIQELVEWTRQAAENFEQANQMRIRYYKVNQNLNPNELDLWQIQENWYTGIVHLYHATLGISRDILESLPPLKPQLAILHKEDPAGAILPTQQLQDIELRARTMYEQSYNWMSKFRHKYIDIQLPKRIFDGQFMPSKGSRGSGAIEGKTGFYADSMPFRDAEYNR